MRALFYDDDLCHCNLFLKIRINFEFARRHGSRSHIWEVRHSPTKKRALNGVYGVLSVWTTKKTPKDAKIRVFCSTYERFKTYLPIYARSYSLQQYIQAIYMTTRLHSEYSWNINALSTLLSEQLH